MTDGTSFRPDWASPPGDTIVDLLEELGWSQAALAERTGFSAKHVNDLVKGRAAITADGAERLSRVLGSTPEFWLVREAHFRGALERQAETQALGAHSGWLAQLPLKWMISHGWVERRTEPGNQVRQLFQFFGVASVDAWREVCLRPVAALRASTAHALRSGSLAAWLRAGERLASARECQPYDAGRFRDALSKLRELTAVTDPSVFVPQLESACAAAGVAVAFVPAPPGCPASGATKWLGSERAMLLLSLRYKSNDHLWFTFFHEAAHILLHGKKMLFVEGYDGINKEDEAAADQWAGDTLIPPVLMSKIRARCSGGVVSAKAVYEFARQAGVAPGIVVGRLQKEGLLAWTHLNDLKVKYEWQRG